MIHDPVVAAVPPALRPLFFPTYVMQPYESLRFMGFFVEHTATGEVTGQLPHGFPASIAIGYGLDGLTGARLAVAAWAILGLVALYVFAARLAGPITAFAAAALLSVHVIELWFARYPNSEIVPVLPRSELSLRYARTRTTTRFSRRWRAYWRRS